MNAQRIVQNCVLKNQSTVIEEMIRANLISEEYLYSDNLLYNMTGTLSCTSLGDSIYTRYYYPSDGYPGYPQTVCDLLSQRNLSTTVIATEQTKISGSKQSLISGKKVIYDSIPGDYTRMYPVKTYYKNKLQPDFLQENQRTYYPFGKLATETGRNGVSTVYLWTKDNGSYPVAKIVNAVDTGDNLCSVFSETV